MWRTTATFTSEPPQFFGATIPSLFEGLRAAEASVWLTNALRARMQSAPRPRVHHPQSKPARNLAAQPQLVAIGEMFATPRRTCIARVIRSATPGASLKLPRLKQRATVPLYRSPSVLNCSNYFLFHTPRLE